LGIPIDHLPRAERDVAEDKVVLPTLLKPDEAEHYATLAWSR
jgi:hypothetical protein